MGELTVTRTMSHSVERVWTALDDFGGIHRFSAGVESSPINPGTPESGVGAERNCHLYDGNHLQERVTASVPNQRLEILIFDTSMPMKAASGAFDLEETSDGGCTLHMTMSYELKFGILGKAMDALMMRRMMTKNLGRLLATLDEHLKTGELIESDWKPARAA